MPASFDSVLGSPQGVFSPSDDMGSSNRDHLLTSRASVFFGAGGDVAHVEFSPARACLTVNSTGHPIHVQRDVPHVVGALA